MEDIIRDYVQTFPEYSGYTDISVKMEVGTRIEGSLMNEFEVTYFGGATVTLEK